MPKLRLETRGGLPKVRQADDIPCVSSSEIRITSPSPEPIYEILLRIKYKAINDVITAC